MKFNRRLIIIILVIAIGMIAAFKFLMSSFNTNFKAGKEAISVYSSQPIIAEFNRHDSLTSIAGNCQHFLLKWSGGELSDVNKTLDALITGNAPVLITIETWPSVKEKFFSPENGVLKQINNGVFDEKIIQLASFLKSKKQQIIITINPEMEVYVKLYPWQMQSPDLYVNAFLHFAELIKSNASNIQIGWSPAGYPGADEYWPGASTVDFIISGIKSKSELMTTNYPEPATQQILFERKIERFRFFDKPILFIGSEKFTKQDFDKTAFESAIAYIKQNETLLYRDAGIADTPAPDNVYRKTAPAIGVFDPKHALVSISGLNTEHLFVNLARLTSDSFAVSFKDAVSRNHDVIVTMEPWKAKGLEKDPNLLSNILNGKYDSAFHKLFSVIKNNKGRKVYLRFLHEMEIPITRYPWQSQDPVTYIKSYRYFVNLLQPKPNNIYMVWGPAGDRGSLDFWPGSDVVDYVSIAIYGLPDKNISDYTKQESFSTIYNRKYRRVKACHKPLFITEFGVKGPEDYKKQWMQAAAETINNDSTITGINYFNFEDNPKAWGDKMKAPDWSTSTTVFKEFVEKLNNRAIKN